MMRFVFAAALCAGAVGPAFASPINTFDSPSDTSGFTPDRFAPAGFVSGVPGGGRSGTLQMSIDGAAFKGFGSFYNTQGMQAALPGGTTSLFIDLYVPSAYKSTNLDQTNAIPTSQGRTAGLWGVGTNGGPDPSAYPIIEFNNLSGGTGGFRTYDTNTGVFSDVAGFSGYDQWYQIGFAYSGNDLTYFVNGQAVSSLTDGNGTTGLSNVILQGYNTGNSYTINFDNLTTTAVPEPTTMVVFGALGFVAFGVRFRRKAVA